MSTLFCTQCGQQIAAADRHCPHCGAAQTAVVPPAAPGKKAVPDGIRGWSWGAFLLSWVWAIGNKTWIGLLALIPYVGLIMAIVLGIKGREWAWQSREWDSVEHFQRVQKQWNRWAFIIVGALLLIGLLAGIGMAMYEERTQHSSTSDIDPDVLAVLTAGSTATQPETAAEPAPQSTPGLCPGSTPVFACLTTKGKAVEICDAGATLRYTFGTPGQPPEMALSIPRSQASTFQWDGRGSSMTYTVRIPNGNTVYEAFTATDRMTEEHTLTAGISVEVDDDIVATLPCRPETIVAELEDIDLPPASWQ